MQVRNWPDYLRNKELLHASNPTDQRVWLKSILVVIDSAQKEYTAVITDLANQAAKLDGKSDIAGWLSAAGTVTFAIPGVVTQIVGGVAMLGGAVWNVLERNKDSKEAARLAEQAKELLIEASVVEEYRLKFRAEYNRLVWMPWVIAVIVVFILLKF